MSGTEEIVPGSGAGKGGQVTPQGGTPTDPNPNDAGQDNGGAGKPGGEPTLTLDQRREAFFQKKGWTKDTGDQQLLDSYEQLEGKMGNWQETERKAKEYEERKAEIEASIEKAQRWDRAQEQLKELEEQHQLEDGKLDLAQLPTDKLANMWVKGKISLADIPADRQFAVQRFVQAQDEQLNSAAREEAHTLVDKHPILKDPDTAALAADMIDKGMFDPKTGKELMPEEIVTRLEGLVHKGEKKTEERIKKDTEMVKNGNLERPGSTIRTQAKPKISSVHDAFYAAKDEMDNK